MGKVTPLHLHANHNRRASRATTGRNLFAEGGDGRSAWALRWKDLILAHANDLGGADILSEAQASIVKRVSTLECQLEATEARLSEGQSIDLGQYARLVGCLARLLRLPRAPAYAAPCVRLCARQGRA